MLQLASSLCSHIIQIDLESGLIAVHHGHLNAGKAPPYELSKYDGEEE